jgi:hypothetical protein
VSARSIFDDLKSRGWNHIDEWIADHEPESLHFDFKQKGNPATYKLEDGDRFNVAKAMSGFANGGGGVLVMGLARTCGKHRDDPDLVGCVAAIKNVQRFLERLDREAADLTEPPISGLDFFAIESPTESGAGVVAILVPASDAVPHRVLKGPNDYYIRIGTRTQPMSHQLLAEQFGRRPVPRLQVRLKIGGEGTMCRMHIGLRNWGRGVARQPAIHFSRIDDCLNCHGPGDLSPGWSRASAPVSGVFYQADSNIVVYPDCGLSVGVAPKQAQSRLPKAIELRGRIYCIDAAPVDFEGRVQPGKDNVSWPPRR